jgi:hypothetical protein
MVIGARMTVMATALLASTCAGKSPEPARPPVSAEPSPPSSPPQSPPPATGVQPPSGGAAASASSAKPVGTKLLQDANDSPKAFKLSKNDGGGHGLGKVSLTVDGHPVWPPHGPGCPELVGCCDELVGRDESLALACLLAVGRDPDCATAMRTSVAIAGESGVAVPPACPR